MLGLICLAVLLIFYSLLFVSNFFLALLLFLGIAVCILYFYHSQLTLFIFGCFLLFQYFIMSVTGVKVVNYGDEAGVLLLFILTIFRKLLNKEKFNGTPIDLLLILIIVIGLIGSIFGGFVSTFITILGLFLFMKGILLFYIFANIPFNNDDIRLYFRGFLVVGIIISVYGLLGMISPGVFLSRIGIPWYSVRWGIPAAQSVFGHPGSFSAFMGVLACFAVSTALVKKDAKSIFLTVFFVIFMIFAFRRTTPIGFVVALGIVFMRNIPFLKYSKSVKKNVVMVLVGIILLFSSLMIKMYQSVYVAYFQSGETARSVLWKTGFKVAQDHFPLGTGFGTFGSGIVNFSYSPLYYQYHLNNIEGLSPGMYAFITDSFWPHIAAELGNIGLCLYLLLFWKLLRIAYKAILCADNDLHKILSLGVFMVLILSFVESLKASYYETGLWGYFYFGLTGILLSWKYLNKIKRCDCNSNILF